jgi:hypothetical protein
VAKKRTQRTKDELEQQKGEPLPKREVMSILSSQPSLISIPEDPTITPEGTDDELQPPPRYDV